MPATATGRGAQIIIDPSSDTAKAVRGAWVGTLEGNLLKAATDIQSGAVADGSGSDGTTSTGVKATDEVMTPAAGIMRNLNVPVASVGNGADTTDDVLQTVVIPANTLRKVGDRLHILAAGTLGATTDTKVVRLKLNGTTFGTFNVSVAAAITWRIEVYVVKTGASAQVIVGLGTSQGSGNSVQNNAGVLLTDTNAITLIVSGQNNTNSVAGSITCNFLSVDYIPA